jgi:PAS domain S-box-containing protein
MQPEFVNLLQSLANGVVVVDESGRIVYSNPFLDDMFGYQRGELVGKAVEQLVPAEVRDIHLKHRARYNASPQTRPMGSGMDLSAVRKNGSTFPVEVSLSHMTTTEGMRVVALITDITKRKRAEEALADSEERYRSLVDNAVFGIFRSSISGEILDVNPAMVAMLGYDTVEELLALNLTKDVYQNPDERQRVIARFADLSSGIEVEWKTKSGKIIQVRLSGRAIGDTAGKLAGFEAIAEDISQRKLLERQFQQAQKMEAIGRLAGGIAHDFNNLLTVISVCNDFLMDQLRDNESVLATLQEIEHVTEQGAGLVRQLMAFSGKQPQKQELVSLKNLIGSSERIFSILAGEDIRVELDLQGGELLVGIESVQLEQILMNLVTNARDAMPRGGTITIATSVVILDEDATMLYGGIKPGKYVRLSVEDTGSGIPAEIQPHIFEPFFTTKEKGKGTGLGLSTVYGIVHQHSGYIGCQSAAGLGTTFAIMLPSASVRVPSVSGTGAPATVHVGAESILLVDDEPLLRRSVRRILEQAGYTVIEAADGFEALTITQKQQNDFQLLITDIVLPKMRGTELAQRLTPMYPHMKVLYMSGYAEDAVLDNSAHFIPKPFKRDVLVRKVREVLDNSSGR